MAIANIQPTTTIMIGKKTNAMGNTANGENLSCTIILGMLDNIGKLIERFMSGKHENKPAMPPTSRWNIANIFRLRRSSFIVFSMPYGGVISGVYSGYDH